jgi:hypothetical protein
MQALLDSTHAALPRPHDKPILDSYDSGEEFSFYHLLQICRSLDEPDFPVADQELSCCTQSEEALEETISEVEPAATYQHLAGNVV